MEIKPTLNLKWYKGKDMYSDGDVEEEIIGYLKKEEPENYGEIIIKHYSWPIYYHLTHTRKNILNWYPFEKDKTILEIGCGLGAITGLLCDKCSKVTAVELSKRRATATKLRCREKENLEIIVGNLNDIVFEEKFDYITLIGVLEYQGTYTDSDNPYRDFLIKIRSLLKPNGKLLIAIENKYGMKYWCGAPEDHTGIPFDGINQYKISGKDVRTFAKEELNKLIIESGFANAFYYYPMPDYKMPTVIYSEEYLPRGGIIENSVPYYVPSDRTLVAEEEGIYQDIIENNVFEFFANSFLVECNTELGTDRERVIFASLNSKRAKEYRTGTVIRSDGTVAKIALTDDQYIYQHLEASKTNIQQLSERKLKVVPYRLENQQLVSNYKNSSTMAEILCNAGKRGDKEYIWNLLDRYLIQIEQSSQEVPQEECLLYELGQDRYFTGKDYGKVLNIGYLDMIPRNCFVEKGELVWFDQEWVLDKIPVKYIMFRGLKETWQSYPKLEKVIPLFSALERYGITKDIKVFIKLEQLFMQMVMDNMYAGGVTERRNQNTYCWNIKKIIE